MYRLKRVFFGNPVRSVFSSLGFLIGILSGGLGIYEFLHKPIYRNVIDVLYLDSFESDVGYERSADTAASFVKHMDANDGFGEPFLFHILIEDYRLATTSGGPPGRTEELELNAASNGLMSVYFDPGCGQWSEGECKNLIVEFYIPGHAEVYDPGVGPDHATRQYPELSERGFGGPYRYTFDFSKASGSDFTAQASEWSLEFYAYARPTYSSSGSGELRLFMEPVQTEPDRLIRTLQSTKNQLLRLFKRYQGPLPD